MPVFYVESSALLKRYRSEIGSDVVFELLDGRSENHFFTTSHFSILEAVAVVTRLRKGALISEADHDYIVRSLLAEVAEAGMIVVPLDAGLVPEALELLPGNPLRAADALHVATARRVHRTVGAALIVVSADREIIAACRALDLNVLDPEERGALDQLRRMR